MKIDYRVNMNNLTENTAAQLDMNEIAFVEFAASTSLFFDAYKQNRATGSFILIDPLSNATVGAGMIREETASKKSGQLLQQPASGDAAHDGVTEQERRQRYGHFPAVFWVNDRRDVAKRLERNLLERGFVVFLLRQGELLASALPSVLSALWSAGIVVVYAGELTSLERSSIQAITGDRFFAFPAAEPSAPTEEILHQALRVAETLRIGTYVPNKGVSAEHD